MNESANGSSTSKYMIAVEVPEGTPKDVVKGRWIIVECFDGADISPTTDRVLAREYPSWKAAVGTAIVILTLGGVIASSVFSLHRLGFWNQFKDLAVLMICSTAWAMAGVFARWLALAARGIPDSSYSTVEYLRRIAADAVSAGLIVTVVLVVAHSVSVQMDDTVTISLSETRLGPIISISFGLGVFTRRARELLHRIVHLKFLREEEVGQEQEQEKGERK
jgi:hypothetical protein